MRERSWRTVAAVGGLVGLVAVVAFAAAARGPGRGETRPSAHAPRLLEDYAATLFAIIMVVGAGAVLYTIVLSRGQRAQRRGDNLRSMFVTVFVVALALIAATHIRPGWLNLDNGSSGTKAGHGAKGKKKDGQTAAKAEPYQPQFRWVPVVVVGALIVGIGGSIAFFSMRRRRDVLRDAPIVVALSDVIAESLDDLRDEPDARTAVIRSYSRMERTLSAYGLPRQETEAPLEYLARMLVSVQASGHSVRLLTQLFQRARFSTHEIDTGMKDDAIAALSGLQAELEFSRA